MWLPPRRYLIPSQSLETAHGVHGLTRGTLLAWQQGEVTGYGDIPDALSLRDGGRHADNVHAFAEELAKLHAAAQCGGIPLRVHLRQTFAPQASEPPPLRLQATTDFKRLPSLAFTEARFEAVKVKLTGRETLNELDSVLGAWREGPGRDTELRIDVNGGWRGRADLDRLLELAARLGASYVEDPVPLADLPIDAPLPIAIDALDCTPQAAMDAVLAGRAQVLVVKPPLWGSVGALLEDLERLRVAGIPWVLSSGLDGPVGLWQLRQLRAILPDAAWAAGIATDGLWHADFRLSLEGDEVPLPVPVPLVLIERSFSQSTLADWTTNTCANLWRAGVRPGDRVATWARNSAEVVAVWRAVRELGATWVPLHPRLTRIEAAALLARVGARVVILGTGQDAAVAAGLPAAVLRTGALPQASPAAPESVRSGLEPVACDAALAAILFTSGSSGPPKGVLLPRTALDAAATAAAHQLAPLGPLTGAMWLCCLPLCHVSGLVLLERAAKLGLTVGLLDQPDTRALAEALAAWQPELISLVPAQLTRLMDLGVRPWPGLRAVLVGGAPCPPDLVDAATSAGWPILVSYGMTETAAQVVTAPLGPLPTPWPRASDAVCVGKPLHGVTIRAVDGELQVKSAQVMAGYLDDPEATATALQDGWLHTGDLGRVDENGWVWVRGRRGEMIVRGGENIAPDQVEAALAVVPGVVEVCVVGIPDRVLGQRVGAWLVVDAPLSSEILATALDGIAEFARPQVWLQTGEPLPRTGPGKIAREAVRQRLLA